jgi:hypothetical protein
MRFALVFVASLAFACAGSKAAKPDATKPPGAGPTLASNAGGPDAKGKYVCAYEEKLGSHVPVKVCRYQDENSYDDTRDRLQDSLRGPQGTTQAIHR